MKRMSAKEEYSEKDYLAKKFKVILDIRKPLVGKIMSGQIYEV
jgi:hypothetical protein